MLGCLLLGVAQGIGTWLYLYVYSKWPKAGDLLYTSCWNPDFQYKRYKPWNRKHWGTNCEGVISCIGEWVSNVLLFCFPALVYKERLEARIASEEWAPMAIRYWFLSTISMHESQTGFTSGTMKVPYQPRTLINLC